MKAFVSVLAVCLAAGLAARAEPARVPSSELCHPTTVDATLRANLDRDARLERILRVNASCAHEATISLADSCRGRTRTHRVRGFGWLRGLAIVEANARADGKELVVGFLPQRRGPRPAYSAGFGRVVVVKLVRDRAAACPALAYLFVHELRAPPLGAVEAELAVETAQLQPATASLEIRIVESFGRDGKRETHARYDRVAGRYIVYETSTGLR